MSVKIDENTLIIKKKKSNNLFVWSFEMSKNKGINFA